MADFSEEGEEVHVLAVLVRDVEAAVAEQVVVVLEVEVRHVVVAVQVVVVAVLAVVVVEVEVQDVVVVVEFQVYKFLYYQSNTKLHFHITTRYLFNNYSSSYLLMVF